jgi:hypothetical protein
MRDPPDQRGDDRVAFPQVGRARTAALEIAMIGTGRSDLLRCIEHLGAANTAPLELVGDDEPEGWASRVLEADGIVMIGE